MARNIYLDFLEAKRGFVNQTHSMKYMLDMLDAEKQQDPYFQEIEQNANDPAEEDMVTACALLKDAADAGISSEDIMEVLLEDRERDIKRLCALQEKNKILNELPPPVSTEKPKPEPKPRTTCKVKVFSNDKDNRRADSNTTPVAVHSIASRCRLLFARMFGRSETKDMVEGPDRKAYRNVY